MVTWVNISCKQSSHIDLNLNWIQKIDWQQWLVRWKTFSILTFSLSAVWRRPWYRAGESWVQAVLWITTGKMSFFCIYSKSILDLWADTDSNWCFCRKTEVWGKEMTWKSQTQCCTSLNPRGSVSRTTLPQTGVPWRELNSCSLLGRAGHQVAFATATRVVGWKVNFCSSYLF